MALSADYRSPFADEKSDVRIKHHQVKSSATGISYPVHVFLPKNYAVSSQKYPVVYATDGQWLADLYWAVKEKNIILVAIEEGPKNRRVVDYV